MHIKRFFPITSVYNERAGWGGSRQPFREIFLRTRRKDTTWYAVDIHILSWTKVRFVVFGIADAVYGGAGSKLYEYDLELTAEESAKAIRPVLEEHAQYLARQRREQELKAQEEAIIAGYARDMLIGLGCPF